MTVTDIDDNNNIPTTSITTKNKRFRMWDEELDHCRSNNQILQSEWTEKMKTEKFQALQTELRSIETQLKLQQQQFKERTESLQQQIQSIRHQSDTVLNQHYKNVLESIIMASLQSYIDNHVKNQNQLLSLILSSFKEETTTMTTAHQALCHSLQRDAMLMQNIHSTALQTVNTTYNTRCRNIAEVWDERSGVSRVLAEERMTLLHQAIKENKAMFDNDTKEEQLRYAELHAEDAHDSAIINENRQQLTELQHSIQQWRQKLATDAEKWTIQLGDAKAEKSRALEAYSALQQQGIQQQRQHEEIVKGMSSNSASIEKDFIDLVERMEKIVKALELEQLSSNNSR